MNIKLFTNGKINPIGVDFDEVVLSVEAQLIGEFDYVCFKLYNSIDDVNSGKHLLALQSKDTFVHVDTSKY